MSISTCRDCGERRIGCHGECEKYKAAQEENRKMKEWLRAENDKCTPMVAKYNATKNRYENRPRGVNRRKLIRVKGGAGK